MEPKTSRVDGTYALIISPTRELALQTSLVIHAYLFSRLFYSIVCNHTCEMTFVILLFSIICLVKIILLQVLHSIIKVCHWIVPGVLLGGGEEPCYSKGKDEG